MAGNTDPISTRASRQATDWLIRLQDDPEDAELAARFDAWLRHSPANADAWEATRRASGAIAAATPAFADRWRPYLDAARGEASGVVPFRRPGRRWLAGRRWVGIGAVAALAASIALVVAGPGLLLGLRADHATGTAETRSVRLADDSVVVLAPESAIEVDFAAGERRIGLLAGEAFFEVAADPGRPFRVAVGQVDVVVLGTGFAVRRGDAGAEVGVEHGVVRVDRTAALPPVSLTLSAGGSLRVGWSGPAEPGRVPAGQVAAWRRNQLIAQDQPLGEIVDVLRRYHAGLIVVTDAALAARPVTGVYNLADPVDALRAVARAQKAVVRRVTPWLLLVSPT